MGLVDHRKRVRNTPCDERHRRDPRTSIGKVLMDVGAARDDRQSASSRCRAGRQSYTADMTERISLFDGYASSSCHDQRGCWAFLAIGGRTLRIVVGAGGHAEADCESGG
jgi:hypothetical protein